MKSRMIPIFRTAAIAVVWMSQLLSEQTGYAQQAWTLLPQTNPNTPIGVFAVTEDQNNDAPIFMVGANGMIRKSISGGAEWTTLTSGTSSTLNDVHFLDRFFGFAVGQNVILKTTNGGTSWSATNFPGVTFNAIDRYAIHQTIWVAGSNGTIYKSTNEGASWTQVTVNTTADLYDIKIISTSLIIAAGENGTICRSTDGGATWSVSTVGSALLRAAEGTSGGFLYIVGEGGTILRSNNNGQSWITMPSGTTLTLTDIVRFDNFDNVTIAIGISGTILRSINNGSWSPIQSGTFESLTALAYRLEGGNEIRLWAVGSKGNFTSTHLTTTCTPPTATRTSTATVSTCIGGSVTLSGLQSGTVGKRVWKKNGVALNVGSSTTTHPLSITLTNLQATDAGSYVMEVTGPCGTATSDPITVAINSVQQPSTIVGPGLTSQNVATTYSVSPIPGATYNWSPGSGGTVTGTGNEVQISWSTVGSKTISVTATDACGTSAARNATVNVISCTAPVQPSVITRSTGSECTNASATYSVTAVAGVTYTWSLSGGGTIAGSGNSATVIWNATTGSRTITVTPSNACGNGTARMLNVTVDAVPTQPSSVSGLTTVCSGVGTAYSITNVAGTTYSWDTGGAGTISGSGNSISATWNSAGQKTLAVTPSNACGAGTPRTLSVSVSAAPGQPSVIVGANAVQTGATSQYSVTAEAGVNYAWNGGAGSTVTGSGNSVNISWSSAGSKTITVTPSNSCGNGTVRTLPVTVTDCAVPAQPSSISGSATNCIGTGVYSVTAVGGVSYTWNAGSGGSVTGSGNSVTLSWSTTGVKTITVTPFNSCGVGTPQTMNVTVNQFPNQPAAISGSTAVCKGTSGTYNVTNVPGVTYTWDTGGRGTITGSGNSVNILWTATGDNELRVTPSNACGNGMARTTIVTVNDVPLPASAITGSNFACTNASGTYSVTNVPGVTYVWNAGSGGVVTGSGNSVSISWSTPGVKTIQLTPTNACGSAAVRTLDVTVTAPPEQPSTISGSVNVNAGITHPYSVTNVPGVTYAWSASGGLVAGSGNSVQITWATSGTKTVTVTPSNHCGNGTPRTFNVDVSVPCVIPGVPASLDGPVAFNLNQTRRYTVGASSGATSLSIAVTPTTGVTITPVSSNQWDINFTSAGEFIVSAVGIVSGCDNGTGTGSATGPPITLPVSICAGSVATPTGLAGPTSNVCKFSKSRYTVTALPGLTYEWAPLGTEGSFEYLNASKSEVEVTWNNPGAPSISVRARDACNNVSSYASLSIAMVAPPSSVSISTSPTPPYCAGSNITYTITNPQGGVTYSWDLKGPGTVAGDNLSATILATTSARSIDVFGSNGCFINSSVNTIGFGGAFPIPLQPSPIAGPTSIDINVDGTYSVAAQPNVNFLWDAGAGATITPTADQHVKQIRWSGGGAKTIFVSTSNSCGSGEARTLTVNAIAPCSVPNPPTSVTRLHGGNICKDIAYAFSVPYVEGVSYNWSAGADATITGTGNQVLIKWSTVGNKDIIASYTNACGTSGTQQTSISISTPPAALSITGNATACQGTAEAFGVANVGGVSYSWEAPGATITGQGTNNISINNWPNTGVNTVRFKPSNACGFGPETTLAVTVNAAPAQPSEIIGSMELCVNTSTVYTVANVSGVTYTWDAGANSTVTGTGNSRTISWSTPGSKILEVSASNTCGTSVARMAYPEVITVPAQPSAIAGAATVSVGSSESYSVTGINGVTYAWSLPAGGILNSSGNNASVFWSEGGASTLSVTPSNTCGVGTARTKAITVNKILQSITFTLASPVLATDVIELNGEATSGLPIIYTSSNTNIAEVAGSLLLLKGSGTVDITAAQAGDGAYAPAANVVRNLVINKASQIISFDALSDQIFGNPDFILQGSSDAGLPVSFASSNTSVATISGNIVNIVGAGTTDITATQGGNAIYNAATPLVRALTVNKADQLIEFEPLVAKGISDPPFSLTAEATSGLEVSFSSSNPAVATVSGLTVTIVGVGETTITATQLGNTNYNAAPPVERVLTVNSKQSQTITFASLASRTFGDAPFDLTASASSNLAIVYTSSNQNVATLNGSTVTIVGAGTTTITASQSGDDDFNPAVTVARELVVNKAAQTITFAELEVKLVTDAAFNLSATSSSGLAVVFVSSDLSVATVSGNTVTLVGAGTTQITASQAGNENYLAAENVVRTLIVNTVNKQSQAITFGPLQEKTFGDGPFALTAAASSDLPVTYTSSNTAVATISGNTVTVVGAGSTIITAAQQGNEAYDPAASVSQTLTVNKASQAITFAALEQRGLTAGPFNLTAASSSGLTVIFTSSDASVASVSGNTVTPQKAGVVTITASQAGNDNYNAAEDVVQALTIVDDTPTRIITVSGNLVFGELILPETATRSFTIENGGNQALQINSITYPEGYSGSANNTTIAAGSSLTVQVTFAPTQAKEYNGTIVITSNATSGNGSINVAGSAVTVTAIEDATGLRTLRAFPNPSSGMVTLEINKPQSSQVMVTDELGRVNTLIDLQQVGEGLYRADISHLAQGMYIFKLPADRQVKMVRVIKIN